MQRVGAALWPNLKCIQIYGANTDVGKTIVSSILGTALRNRNVKTNYIKPVSAGPIEDADHSHISKFIPGAKFKTLFQLSQPLSPHLAAQRDGKIISDDQVRIALYDELREIANETETDSGVALVETAGGVLSPAPSGSTQADLFRPLRLPVLLVGDHRLGGIGATISAFESLRLRGYDVHSIVVFQDQKYGNLEYLQQHFKSKDVPAIGFTEPPERVSDPTVDEQALRQYYAEESESESANKVISLFDLKHRERIESLNYDAQKAHDRIWYPFTQHQGRSPKDIFVIDSAYGDFFDALTMNATSTENQSMLQPALDGSASWWTQGLGHGNPELALSAAYAAGRYGHVMFASAVHKPALDLADDLIRMHANPRLHKVFYTDNGSTGMEVAVKMALRASCVRYEWDHTEDDIKILGLMNSYHGDTMGVMDCSEPSTYNKKVEWYHPRGYWFDYPQVQIRDGRWFITPNSELEQRLSSVKEVSDGYERPDDLFNFESRLSVREVYERYIRSKIEEETAQGTKFGALVIEPVLLGAGGMVMPDPLFQRVLVDVVRSNPDLISSNSRPPAAQSTSSENWSGLPVIFDEVFTGIYRLGHFNTSALLGVWPDVIVNAKLLTGGLIPLCTTTASQEIFEAFLSDQKADALLHGHSYTAHAVGCNVAVDSLKAMDRMNKEGSWTVFKEDWAKGDSGTNLVWSMWSRNFVDQVSKLETVDYVVTMGSVLAIALRDPKGLGYNSTAAQGLHTALLKSKEHGWNIHSRVLGNILYLMTSMTISQGTMQEVETRVLKELCTQ